MEDRGAQIDLHHQIVTFHLGEGSIRASLQLLNERVEELGN